MDIKLTTNFFSRCNNDICILKNKLKGLVHILIFMFSFSIYSQDYIKRDSIKFNSQYYNYTHVSFGSTSHTKYFKLMTCPDSNLKQIQQTIIDCTKKNKLEYTEFYILDLPYDTIKNIPDKDILFALLFKIDQHRMSLNLSTVTVKQKYNIIDDKFSYFPDESREKFIDYKLNISENEVCIFLKK